MPNLLEYKKERTVEVFYTGGDVKVTKDGLLLFTACTNVVKVLDASNGEQKTEIGDTNGDQRITCFAISNDDAMIAVAFTNDLIQLYSICDEEFTMIRQFRGTHNSPILLMEFSPDNNSLATGGADHYIKVFDVKQNFCTHNYKGKSIVTSLCYPTGEYIVAGYADGLVRAFDLSKAKTPVDISGHSGQISAILFSDIETLGPSIITVSRDQTYTICGFETWKKHKTIPIFEAVEGAVLLENRLVTAGEEGIVRSFDLLTGKKLAAGRVALQSIDILLHSSLTSSFICATSDQNIVIVDDLTLTIRRQFIGFNDEIFSACQVKHLAGSYLVVGTNSSELRIYNTADWSCRLVSGHEDCVLDVHAPSWMESIFGSSSKDSHLVIWKMNDLDQKPDDDKTLVIPKLAGKIGFGSGHTAGVSGVRFSNFKKDSPFVVTVSYDSTVKLWPLADVLKNNSEIVKMTATATMVAHKDDITCVEVSPNDQLCATGSMDKSVRLWHIDRTVMKLGIAGTLNGHRRGIWTVKFSPNSQTLATGSGDSTIKIFNLLDNTCLKTLEGHDVSVTSLHFLSSGSKMVSGDGGGIMKIWDINLGVCDKTFEGHEDKIWDIVALADEKDAPSNIVSVGSDGKICVWKDVSDEKKLEESKEAADRLAQVQTLNNLMDQAHYSEALKYALNLKQPYNCLKVVNKITETKDRANLCKVVSSLMQDQVVTLIDYCSQWNTNTRTYQAAQEVLNALLKSLHPDEILQLPNIGRFLQTFIPYTNRHLDRLNNLDINTHYLTYLYTCIRL